MKKIGLVYLKGSLPAFEGFGELPTHIVKQNGLVNGIPAHKVLDGLIIPGGSIIESSSITHLLGEEIKKMANNGALVLGMCSGFQLLAQSTDIGRKSPCPLIREGLGLLDVSFHPMISNDRVEAEINDESAITKGMVGQKITGFHCHTYGDIRGQAQPIMHSLIRRSDYKDHPRKVLSGVCNDEGNVVGTMLHASLDENTVLKDNFMDFIGANEQEVDQIKEANQILIRQLKKEVGIETGLNFPYKPTDTQLPPAIMIASTGSDSGKTFLTTGISGALRKKGYKVAVLKVGPDVRDIVPSLYLTKERMETFSSINIGGLGWQELPKVLEQLKTRDYHIILIEGVMGIFTGLLNEKTPFSAAEIAKAANIPVIMVSGCNKGGIETAALDLLSHISMLKQLDITVSGAILNKVYDPQIAQKATDYIEKQAKLDFIISIPKIKMDVRGGTPEVEIKLEDFCLSAMQTVEKHLNPKIIMNNANIPQFQGFADHNEILNSFR